MISERIIYSNKSKSLKLLLGSSLFVLLAVWVFINAEKIADGRFYNPLGIQIIMAIGILFFGIGFCFGIYQLLKKRAMLHIDAEGITVGLRQNEKILWENIVGFKSIRIKSAAIILILTNNSEEAIAAQKNPIKKRLMQMNNNLYGSAYSVSSETLDIKHDDLLALLESNFNAYKNQK